MGNVAGGDDVAVFAYSHRPGLVVLPGRAVELGCPLFGAAGIVFYCQESPAGGSSGVACHINVAAAVESDAFGHVVPVIGAVVGYRPIQADRGAGFKLEGYEVLAVAAGAAVACGVDVAAAVRRQVDMSVL